MKCRYCDHQLEHIFLDLGFAPASNAYIQKDNWNKPEKYYPLKLFVCDQCWLVQTDDYAEADELFSPDYAYFSSISTSWLEHAKTYTDMITERLGLNSKSHVIEIASNDGYLLKNFVAANVPCLGVEPTASTAEAARKLNIPVAQEFFGEKFAKSLALDGKQADLILGNNVYAHVPFINDFTKGLKIALKPGGTITLEFPHLMRLIENNQFDTVYHEHFSYLALGTVKKIFEEAGLKICDVEELSTHGGSLRVYGCHSDDAREVLMSVAAVLKAEVDNRLNDLPIYLNFQEQANKVKNDLLEFLIEQKRAGKSVMAYGAAAKGNTLMNFGGIKTDLISTSFDAAPSKQDTFLPGSHIPVLHPERMKEMKPNYVIIMPWNIADEIIKHHSYINEWGGKFVVSVPELKIL